MLNLNACCPHGLIRQPKLLRPELIVVKVKNCKLVNSEEWCEITKQPVLINDENLKNHIIKMEKEPCFK